MDEKIIYLLEDVKRSLLFARGMIRAQIPSAAYKIGDLERQINRIDEIIKNQKTVKNEYN